MGSITRLVSWRREGPLGYRLLAAIVIASTALALVATGIQLYVDYRRDLLAINDELAQIERTYLESLANSLWSFNDTQIRLQLDGLLQLPDMQHVEVRGSRGEYFSVGRRPDGEVITRSYPLHYRESGPVVLGVLEVTVALEGVYRRLIEKAIVILATQTAKTFLVSLLILFIVSRWVTRHLEQMARYARGMSLDRLGERITLQRKPAEVPDELDHVASALNDMSEALGSELDRRTAVEQALRQSEQRFRDYAETASDWFWETGPDDRFTFLSERLAALGGNPEARLGKQRLELAADRDEEPEKWAAHLAALEAHQPFREFVYRTKIEDNTTRFVAISGKPLFDDKGTFLGYRGGGRDVTEAVRAEQALRDAKAEAEAANKAKSVFLANMSHELRTPLNAIIGFSEIMKLGILGTAQAERTRSYATDIHASGTHLLEIINDILDVAQIEAGKFEFNERVVPLQSAVKQVVRMLAPQAEKSSLSLLTDLPRELLYVRADERAMRQILLNLASNALKFSPCGGRVTIGLDRRNGEVRLRVTDTGIGIAPENIDKLMRPFTQLDNVYQRKYQGSGLGLALVRSLTEMHGGTVAIESELGRGTVVSVLLPAARVADAPPTLSLAGVQ